MNNFQNESAAKTKEVRPRLISSWLVNAAVSVFIVLLLAAILFPVGTKSSGAARRSSCSSNLKQIGLATMQYMQEYDDHLPPLTNGRQTDGKTQSWRSLLSPYQRYTKVADLWKCAENPASKSDTLAVDGLPLGYDAIIGGPIRNGKPLEISYIKSPFSVILAFEENGDNAEAQQIGALWDKDNGDENWTNILYAGHLGTSNYLFLDGHVKSLRPMTTIYNHSNSKTNLNFWNINNKAPVSPRALAKLKAAQQTFD